MSNKIEMMIGEWFIRLVCVTLASGIVILGVCGIFIIGMTDLIQNIASQKYDAILCMGIAWLSALFGLSPMAQWILRNLLHSFGGLKPLPSKRRGHEREKKLRIALEQHFACSRATPLSNGAWLVTDLSTGKTIRELTGREALDVLSLW